MSRLISVGCILMVLGLGMYGLGGADPHNHGREFLMGIFMGAAIALLAAPRIESHKNKSA
jgi:hypothetical protein